MTETTVGREPIQIVEIQQPFCQNTYGVSPCTASGGADVKCYNTRATCQDTANFALGSPLSLFFSRGNVADRLVGDGAPFMPHIIPSLVSVSTVPTQINLAAASPDAQGLGTRALCTLVFQDHPHTDRGLDPYVAGRSWDPLDASRGSFWTRWLVRNKYRQNILINVYEGYAGQALADMKKRSYFLQSVSGPDESGRVTIQGKDILARIEERKAQAPAASPGELASALTDVATSFEVAGATTADYAASGTLRIDDEIVTYTSRSTSGSNVLFSGVTRGTDGTVAAEHEAEAVVQQCLRYTDQAVDDVISDLLQTYGGISSAYLDLAGWATEVDTYANAYRLTALITEPTAVSELVSEIQTQALVYVWWNERDAKVKLKVIRGIDAEPDLLTDAGNIIGGSFALKEKPRERISQVTIYYQQSDYVGSPEDQASYLSAYILKDAESETAELYGEPSIRTIYARWLRTAALAQSTATRIIRRYVDTPSQCTFAMDAKDRAYWVGDTMQISHFLDVDQYGSRRVRNWTITSAEEVEPGHLVRYTAEDTTLYGRIHYIMASGAADYPGYASAPFKNCYIGDANGLLSDGQEAGKVS